jgi:hypothetical protein
LNELHLLEQIRAEFEIASTCVNNIGSAPVGIIHFVRAWHGIYILQHPGDSCSFDAFLADAAVPANPGLSEKSWLRAMGVLQSAKNTLLENEWYDLDEPGTGSEYQRATRTLKQALRLLAAQVKRKHKLGFYDPRLRVSVVVFLVVVSLFFVGNEVRKMLAPKAFAVSVFDNADFAGTPSRSYVRSLDLNDSSSLGGLGLDASFSLRATACIKVPKTGKLRVAIASDDGSRVLVDGETIIDNWGIHGLIRKENV